MNLNNLIEKITQSQPGTNFTIVEEATILGLREWQPTKAIKALEALPDMSSEEIESNNITSSEIQNRVEDEAKSEARQVTHNTIKDRKIIDLKNDFLSYGTTLKQMPDWVIQRNVERKTYRIFPKIRLNKVWTEMYDTYQQAYNNALNSIDKEAIKAKLLKWKKDRYDSDKKYAIQRYNEHKSESEKIESKLKEYENNGYINRSSIKSEFIIPGMISAKGEMLYHRQYLEQDQWVKFKPIAITTLDEAIKNPEKFQDKYVFMNVIMGPYEENSRIEGGMKTESHVNITTSVEAESNSSSFLFFSDSDSKVKSETNYNVRNSASAWIFTKKESIDFIMTSNQSKMMTVCTFPINGTIKAYSLQPDKEKKILTSPVSETHLALTLQNLKNSQREVLIGGNVDDSGIFKADTILASYAGMSHNIGYLEHL
jgi:hypothetical protein